jgi:hypothetical protein
MATVLPAFNPIAGIPEAIRAFRARQLQQQQQRQQAGDVQNLLQFLQQTQQGGAPALPQFQTPGIGLQAANFLAGQPSQLERQQALANLGLTQARTSALGVQQQPEGFTLGPGQQRFQAGGQQIASVPATPKPKAGAMQVAKENDSTGLAAGTVFQADPQGKVTVISEAGGEGLTAADKTKIAVTQAKEFRADERIKNLQIIERSERGMKAALNLSRTGKSRIASDQALGVLFQKMLDPSSVVRQSEYIRTPEGAAALNRLIGGAEALVKGGLKLTDTDRESLVTMAQRLLDESKITANKAFAEFGTRAKEIGLNERIVFGGAKPFDLTSPITLTQSLQQGASEFGVGGTQNARTPQQEARMQELLKKAGK